MLKSVAKNDGKLGNTITSVITHLLVKGLEEEFNYKFHPPLGATKPRASMRMGEAIPYPIKSKILSAQERSSIAFYANDISAKQISVAEATAQMNAANAELLGFLEQGYSLEDLHPNKKSFGHKWSEGDWIWEVSQKTDEDEIVMVNGKEVSRKARLETDTHYLQYVDNGIEIIAPNIFTNALYMSYEERDPYFNNEFCPEKQVPALKKYLSDKDNIDVFACHLVKLQVKNERRYRYICLDCYNIEENTYKQIVFMNERGNQTTSKDFYKEFDKVVSQKKSKHKVEN